MSDRTAGPTAANRQAFVGKARLVTLPTRAGEPVLASSMPEPGPHIKAVGAISPERMEFVGKGRPAGAHLTLFEATGRVISDLSLGIEVLSRARARTMGRAMPHPRKAQPDLRAATPVRTA
jgi:ornithine cyclodeaminase/alanine dehydrogenase-like protein (mu-crystallin family)